MSVAEHTLSHLLRNSGEVLEEVEQRDVVLQRRDGEDLYLALHSREKGLRESLGILSRMVRAALHDKAARSAIATWIAEELPWTGFLPPEDREEFLDDFARTTAACVDIQNYEPLVQTLRGWKATAEAYADPMIARRLLASHRGTSVRLRRPVSSRAKAR